MDTLIYVVATQIILIPILGGIYLGIRNERKQYKRLLGLAIINTMNANSRRRR